MRYVLATVAFIISAPLLGWAVFVGYLLIQAYLSDENFFRGPNIRIVMALDAVFAVVGLLFLVAGVAMLGRKPRREN